LTLTQNYRRLGLASRLNVPAGGVEKDRGITASLGVKRAADPLHISRNGNPLTEIQPDEVRVERDPKTGNILRVVREGNDDEEVEIAGRKRRQSNPLGDPLNELLDNERHAKLNQEPSGSKFIQGLELRAAREAKSVKKRRPRQQSQREQEWVLRLVEKHGDNYLAMFRDRKLNPMQQTEGDLRRRIRIWNESQS
jgi:nucleolar protein 16